MVKKVVECDICGRQYDPYRNRRVKMKVRNENYCNFDDWEYRKWVKYDICPSCAENLITWAEMNSTKNTNDITRK